MQTQIPEPERRRRREELRARARRRRRALAIAAVCALAAGAIAAFSLVGGGSESSGNGSTPTAVSADETIDEIESVIGKIVRPWPDEQASNGLFRDPTTGRARPGFGPPMLGQALMREGKRTGDRRYIDSGLRVVTTTARRKKGLVENPLTLLAVASAYNWAKRNLADDPAFRGSRRAWEAYLAEWSKAEVGKEAQQCFADPRCFNNYKLIEAVAVLELLRTGVEPANPQTQLANPRDGRSRAIAALSQAAPKAAGKGARTLGADPSLKGIGILADEPTYPLAYHPLSVMMLGRGIELLGDDAPPAALATFRRTMEALNAFAGPDGDVAYVGRAQQEIWALGAAVYAGELCGRLFARSQPDTAGRCRTLAARTLNRISEVHGFGAVGVNVVPRFKGQQKIDRRGLDRYARFLSYNGMTALFLEYAEDQLATSRGVEGRPLPLDKGGAFVDPERTRFAAVRKGDTWLAVHAVGPVRVKDVRYDFGLSALKLKGDDGRWRDVLRPRPNAPPDQATDGMGPTLLQGEQVGVPWGESVRADPKRGEIVVRGGWRAPRQGPWLRRGVTFRFRALEDGVRISFPARAGDRFLFRDFVHSKGVSGEGARELRSRDSVSLLPRKPDRRERQGGLSSATDTSLVAITRYLTVERAGEQSWTIRTP